METQHSLLLQLVQENKITYAIPSYVSLNIFKKFKTRGSSLRPAWSWAWSPHWASRPLWRGTQSRQRGSGAWTGCGWLRKNIIFFTTFLREKHFFWNGEMKQGFLFFEMVSLVFPLLVPFQTFYTAPVVFFRFTQHYHCVTAAIAVAFLQKLTKHKTHSRWSLPVRRRLRCPWWPAPRSSRRRPSSGASSPAPAWCLAPAAPDRRCRRGTPPGSGGSRNPRCRRRWGRSCSTFRSGKGKKMF